MAGVTPFAGGGLPATATAAPAAAIELANIERDLGHADNGGGVFRSHVNPRFADGSAEFLDPTKRLADLGYVDVRFDAPETTREVQTRMKLLPWVTRTHSERVPAAEVAVQGAVTPSGERAKVPDELIARAKQQGIDVTVKREGSDWPVRFGFDRPLRTLDHALDPRVGTIVEIARDQAMRIAAANHASHRATGVTVFMSGTADSMTGAALTSPRAELPTGDIDTSYRSTQRVALESLPYGHNPKVHFIPAPGTAGIYVDAVQHVPFVQPANTANLGMIPLVDVTGSVVEDALKIAARVR